MNIQNKNTTLILLLLVALMVTTSSYAQFGDIGFPDDVNDEPAAPINGLIAIGLIVGGYLGIKKAKN